MDLYHVLDKYIKRSNKVLWLDEDLYDAGFRNIENMNISAVAIQQMTDCNKLKQPNIHYLQMDLK